MVPHRDHLEQDLELLPFGLREPRVQEQPFQRRKRTERQESFAAGQEFQLWHELPLSMSQALVGQRQPPPQLGHARAQLVELAAKTLRAAGVVVKPDEQTRGRPRRVPARANWPISRRSPRRRRLVNDQYNNRHHAQSQNPAAR